MIILGVDPGLNITGYGVIEVVNSTIRQSQGCSELRQETKRFSPEFARKGLVKIKEAGVIKTKSQDLISARLDKIYKNLLDIIEEYKPKVLVLEKLYSHYKHPVTSILMGHARGIVCLAAGISGIKLISYPSTRIKKAVTGKGHATKLQVKGMIEQLLALKNKPYPTDVTDALACALTYVNMELR